jgi:glycosyltransferase involved in cell wall biosynthesis
MQYHGGISRYFANLHRSFRLGKEVRSTVGAEDSINQYIQPHLSPYDRFFSHLFHKTGKSFKYNENISLKLIRKGNYDILHPTYYNTYFLGLNKKRLVLTIHDMIHEIFPEYYSADELRDSENKRTLAEQADMIIAISHSTSKDIQRLMGIEESRIKVIHHGYDVEISVAINLSMLPLMKITSCSSANGYAIKTFYAS